MSIWSGVSRPIGILMRCIPGASQTVSGPLVRPSDGYGNALGPGAVVALAVVVALPVDAAAEARLGEHLLVYLALPPEGDLALEGVYLGLQLGRNAVGECFLPGHVTRSLPARAGRRESAGRRRRRFLPASVSRR